MCCLFGFVDYAGSLSVKQKNHLIRELSIAAEVRGTDATGIAYNTSRGLQIYKRPLAAYRLHLRIPAEAHVVMGHTRMTTQGSAKKNYNNHPFFGCVKGKRFALAHNGVLFLDELPEFDKTALETLRQPLEDGVVTITRASGSLTLPSRFMLVCAMNPCKCGWRGHPSGKCTCSDKEVEKYVQKISGPLLDRIDLHVNVPSVEYEAMRRKSKPESSAQVKERVDAARAIQSRRFEGTGIPCNAQMTPPMVGRFCELDSRCDALMKSAFERMGLTARSHDRVLRVARTIADLDGAEHIGVEHLSEAIQYRNTDILKG